MVLSDDFHLDIAFIQTIFPLHGNFSALDIIHCRGRCVKVTDGLKRVAFWCENLHNHIKKMYT